MTVQQSLSEKRFGPLLHSCSIELSANEARAAYEKSSGITSGNCAWACLLDGLVVASSNLVLAMIHRDSSLKVMRI